MSPLQPTPVRQCAPARRRNRPGQPDHGTERDDAVPVATWLHLHYDLADQGARPVPSGDAFWESPDIWIEGGDQFGNAIAGQPATVWARVWNGGYLKACGTRVDFAVVDPSLGIPWDQPQLIGAEPSYVNVPEKILGPGFAEVRCKTPWVPAPGSSHACLFAMCSCPMQNDVPAQPWNVIDARQVAQHNVNIVAAHPGQVLAFELHTANILPVASLVQMAVQAAWVSAPRPRDALHYSASGVRNSIAALNRPLDLQHMRLMAARAARLMAPGIPMRGSAVTPEQLPELVRIKRICRTGHASGGTAVIASRTAVTGLNGYTPLGAAAAGRPGEQHVVQLELQVPRPPAGASQLLLRLAQFENGFATGGYTVVLAYGAAP